MSVSRRVTMPEALDLTSTLVMGWTLPVATTERAMSASSALPSWEGSNLVVLPRAATAMPSATAMTRTVRPVHSQILRLFLRCVAKGCSHKFWLVGRLGVWLRKIVVRGSIDGGEKLPQRTRKSCRLLFWTSGRRKGIASLGSIRDGFQAYLRRTPRTLPWMLTLAAGA